jgi:hypothetical protein
MRERACYRLLAPALLAFLLAGVVIPCPNTVQSVSKASLDVQCQTWTMHPRASSPSIVKIRFQVHRPPCP